MKSLLACLMFSMFSLAAVMPASATVSVTSPLNGATLGTVVPFAAVGSTPCLKGVAAMGVYVDNSLLYQVNGNILSTSLSLANGSHHVTLQEWDLCGASSASAAVINVVNTARVNVSSPAAGATVPSPTPISATATSPGCAAGVSSMQVYAQGVSVYTVAAAAINTTLNLAAGPNQLTIKQWDRCGGVASTGLAVSVTAGTKLANLQHATNWNQWGESPPVYDICTSCNGITWKMTQGIKTPAVSGNATEFEVGGTVPYSDVLWSNKLIGQGTTLGLPDTSQTILPSIHHLVFDAEIYPTNLSVTQDIELDANIYLNGVGMEWGTQCNHLHTGVWDIWDNVNNKWVGTSVPCVLNEGAWNHVNITFQRLANNDLVYGTLTVNGVAHVLNITVPPFAVPSSWYGLTLNYQLDGNSKMASYTTYVDNLSLTYY